MKKKRNENCTTYTIDSPSDLGGVISESIFKAMADNRVMPDEVLPILGESVVRFLMMVAEPLGYEKKEIVKVFGEGLATAEIELHEN